MDSAEFSTASFQDWSPTMDQEINSTINDSAVTEADESSPGPSVWMAFNVSLYALICGAGMIGNGLVIYVVLRYVIQTRPKLVDHLINILWLT
jgi:hypothetical protein